MTGMSMVAACWTSLNPWRSGELTFAITMSNFNFPFVSIVMAAEARSAIVTDTK